MRLQTIHSLAIRLHFSQVNHTSSGEPDINSDPWDLTTVLCHVKNHFFFDLCLFANPSNAAHSEPTLLRQPLDKLALLRQPPYKLTPVRISQPSQKTVSKHGGLDDRYLSPRPAQFLIDYFPVPIRPFRRDKLFCLTPKFATGWRKISQELKIEIWEYLVVNESRPHRYFDWDSSSRCHCADDLSIFHSTRELTALAKEIFYRRNQFAIFTHNCPWPPDYVPSSSIGEDAWLVPIRYPSLAVNHIIRRLYIEMRLSIREWIFVKKISCGDLGFQNLWEVTVAVLGPRGQACPTMIQRVIRTIEMFGITFKAKKLHIKYFATATFSHPTLISESMQVRPRFLERMNTRPDGELESRGWQSGN